MEPATWMERTRQQPALHRTSGSGGAPSTAGNLRLRNNSPAIDVGSNTYVGGVATDLDGLTRIFGGIVDMGPYEFGADTLFRDRFEE